MVRDTSSREVLSELTPQAITVLPDLAFSMASKYPYFRIPRPAKPAESIAFVGEVVGGRVAFFGRLLEGEVQDIFRNLTGVEVRYFLMSNDDLPHRDQLVQLLASHGIDCRVHDLRAVPMLEAVSAFRGVCGVVTARFHGLVLSIIAGTPALSIDLSYGKQSVLIRDDFPSMANNLIDERCPSNAIVEKLRTLAKSPSSYMTEIAEIEAVSGATRVYANILEKWINGAKQVHRAAKPESTSRDVTAPRETRGGPPEPAVQSPQAKSSSAGVMGRIPNRENSSKVERELPNASQSRTSKLLPVYSGGNRAFVTLDSGEYVCVDTNSLDSIDYLLDFGMERHVIPVFRRFAKPNSTILDIGANFGLYTAIGGRIIREHGRLIAFEGNPHTFEYLQRTMYANKLYHNKRVQLVNALVSDQSGTGTLHYRPTELGGASMTGHRAPDIISVDVRALTIDEYLADDVKVDLVKIDVEGYEPHVLKGMERTLARCTNVRLIIEAFENFIRPHYGDPDEYFAYLQGLGFAVCRIAEGGKLELLHKAATGDCYYFLTRNPESDVRRHCESIPIETMHFHPELKDALLTDGTLCYDRARHANLKEEDLFFGPYSNLAPGTYSIRLVGTLSGQLGIRLTSRTTVLSSTVVNALNEPILMTITEPIDFFEIVARRTPELERLSVSEIEISRN